MDLIKHKNRLKSHIDSYLSTWLVRLELEIKRLHKLIEKPVHFAHGCGRYKDRYKGVLTLCGKNWPWDNLILTNIPNHTTCKSCRRSRKFPNNLPAKKVEEWEETKK